MNTPPGTHTQDDDKYASDIFTYLTFSRLCSMLHGGVSRIDNAFLVSLVGRRSEKHFWIGLSNKKNYEFFEWTTNQVATYTHWNAGMPGIHLHAPYTVLQQQIDCMTSI